MKLYHVWLTTLMAEHVCRFVWKWTLVLAELFVFVWSKQAMQECAFLCLNKETWNHEIIPRPLFFLSSYRRFFIWIAQVCLFVVFVDSEHLLLLALLAYVQARCEQVCFTAQF